MKPAESIDLATITSAHFEPFLNSEFTLVCDDGRFQIALIEVTDLSGPNSPNTTRNRKSFSMVFHSNTALFNQGIYTIEHPDLAPMSIFLSPFEGGEGRCKLEAIFN